MLKRHEIQVLIKAGHTQKEVAKQVGVSVRTIKRVIQEATVDHSDDAAERAQRGIGRPSVVEEFRPVVEELLKADAGLLSLEILRRARQAGYQGGKTALYELVKSLRPPETRMMVRFEGLPGEFSQHDFGEVDVRFLDGTQERVHFFASRLKYSRWTEVSLVASEQVEPLARSLVEHFERMGGVPLVAVFDRPKTVALAWRKNGEVTEWNSTFSAVTLDLGVGVELCWPYSPQQKGSVENLVGWVKGSFFKQRRFVDRADLEQQLSEWLVEANTQRPSRATGVVPAERMQEERPRLRPTKMTSADLALRIPVFVGPTGMVNHETHLYSMDPDAIGLPGTLYLYQNKVRIVAGRFTSVHDRLWDPHAKSHLPEHRAQAVAAVSGKRAKRYLKREHLLALGDPACDFLTELIHRRQLTWVQDVERLHDFLQVYGPQALVAAFQEALDQQTFGAEYVAHFLEAQRQPSFLENWSPDRQVTQ